MAKGGFRGMPGGMGGMNQAAMLKQAQKMQQEMLRMQEEQENKTFSAQSGGGMVSATVNGKHELLELKVCANGFLYNMVRAITGTVLYAAEGKFLPEDIPAILESRDRTLAGPTVPPGGLYLTRLWYEDERLNG